jgi:hypothetical protein
VRPLLASARLQSLFVYAGIVAVVFTAALVAGFVFAHEPQRETVSIAVRETPLDPPRSRFVSGVIGSLSDGSIVLVGDEQSTAIELPSAVPMDELTYLPADGAPFEAGTVVNLGTADTETGFIITGIVAVEPAAP